MAAAATLIAASGLAGCGSINIPLGNIFGQQQQRTDQQELTTGSLRVPAERVASQALPPPAPAAGTPALQLAAVQQTLLGEDERETVRATLANALLDQERAASVPWLHQRSGAGGMISPVGPLTRQGEARCRAVLISVQRGGETRTLEANACRTQTSDWSLADLRPFRPPV